jgi:GH24 family phage-related lysozyme (muramidase)
MREAVLAAWHRFSEPLEGRVEHMYLDVLGLVTCGVGNLIDSRTHESAGLALATALPWRRPDGTLASADEIEAQWRALRARRDLSQRHYRFARDYLETRFRYALTLTDEAIDELVARKLASNEVELRKRFPSWDSWPADAQLAVASMAWAMGPGFPAAFPTFTRLMNGGDFVTAGTLAKTGRAPCDINSTGNPGVVPRNRLNRAHLVAAGSELARLYPEVLHGPCTLAALDAGWRQADPVHRDSKPESNA